MTGGSIIIPIDISTEATTMSITRNGMKDHEADLKSPCQLREHERRDQGHGRNIILVFGLRILPEMSISRRQVLFPGLAEHELTHRLHGQLQGLFLGDLLCSCTAAGPYR